MNSPVTPNTSASRLFPRIPAVALPSGSLPVILIDQQEKTPLPISFPSEVISMITGDYSYRGGDFAVERKSLPDLVGCLGSDRKRFEGQLQRLRGYAFARLLIVGSEADLVAGNYRSNLKPLAAMNSLHAFEARFIPVVWAATPEDAARLVERWVFWHYRETIQRLTISRPKKPLASTFPSADLQSTTDQQHETIPHD